MVELTKEDLGRLKTAPKTMDIGNPKYQRGSDQWNADVHIKSFDTETQKQDIPSHLIMKFFARQNKNDKTSFSCGIWIYLGEKKVTLVRYNGSNHEHKEIKFQCHIHEATMGSINIGDRKSERANTYATDRYNDLQDALSCLLMDFNITTIPRQKTLFGELK